MLASMAVMVYRQWRGEWELVVLRLGDQFFGLASHRRGAEHGSTYTVQDCLGRAVRQAVANVSDHYGVQI